MLVKKIKVPSLDTKCISCDKSLSRLSMEKHLEIQIALHRVHCEIEPICIRCMMEVLDII